MNSKVRLGKIKNYALNEVENFVRRSIELFSAEKPLFGPGQKVLLKPNLLKAAAPEQCVATHPVVVEAVCRALLDLGVARIDIGDSPALGSLNAVARKAGYGPILDKYGVRLTPFSNPQTLDVEDNVAHLKIAGNLTDYDQIVNLPKFKSHRQMTLTLSIKNLFGCVIGKRKPVLHCLVGNDKIKFGKMLVEIARHVNPCLTIVDGVRAMEGNGPMGGTPYPLGLLAAGQDMTALDRVLAEIVRVPPEKVFALEAARLKNFGAWDLENIQLFGETDLDTLKVDDFHLAQHELDITFNPLRIAKSFFKQWIEVGIKEKLAG